MQDTLDKIDKVTNSHPLFKSLLYTSLFLHGILLVKRFKIQNLLRIQADTKLFIIFQERKKYNTIGWSLPYNFEYSDFSMCQQIIDTCLRKIEKSEIPWTTIKYLIGEIVYGGKVIDKYDHRIILTYMEEYFGDFIYSSYQPFKFYNCKKSDNILEYTEMEKKLLRNDKNLTSLNGKL